MDKIMWDIKAKLPEDELTKLAQQEYSDEQKKVMSKRVLERLGTKEDIVDLCQSKQIEPIDKSTGEILLPNYKYPN